MDKRIKRGLGLVAVIVDLVLNLTGCVFGVVDLDDDWAHEGDAEAYSVYTRTIPVLGQEVLELLGGNGDVRILGVPGAQEIHVDAVKRVRSDTRRDAKEALSWLHVAVDVSEDGVKIQTVQPEHTQGRIYIVDYEITGPPHLMLSMANGNGWVRVGDVEADVEVANGNGDVTLSQITGSTWVALGNGELSSVVQLPLIGKIDYAVGNGTIHLSVQKDASATFDAEVGNGTISVLGLDLRDVVSTPRHIHGLLGSGQGAIGLAVGNGTIEVHGR
jgi:hypothetical protein